jgi:cytochrome bd-type quinol oxidase subunit 2
VKKINVKAVLLGLLADLLTTVVLSPVVVLAGSSELRSKGKSIAEIAAHLASDPTVLLCALVLGLVAAAVGGFVTGRVAGRDHLRNGVALGVVGVVSSLLFDVRGYPLWFSIPAIALVIPVSVGGALLAKARGSRKRAPAS